MGHSSQRMHGAVQAVVRHAMGRGYLSTDALREALLLQHQMSQSGQPVELLHLLRARYLAPDTIPELTAVYQQALSGAPTSGTNHTRPGLGTAHVRVDPTVELKSSQLVKRPRNEDPRWVQEFLSESSERALTSDEATIGRGSAHLGPGVPEFIGDYRIERELARGGFGVVCHAHSRSLGRPVALKLMRDAAFADLDDVGRFLTEARAAARLKHPGIVGVYEVGEQDGHRFIAMELIRGPSLRKRLEEEGAMEPRAAAATLKAVAEALGYAHDEGILHRDIKPGNILLDEAGQPHLTDFGLAKDVRAGGGPTVTGEILGTPAYMPPEQTRGRMELVDERSDIYALGATLYRMVCGRPPYQGKTLLAILEEVARNPPPRPGGLVKLPRDLETILQTCMEREPDDRYETAQEVADDLGRFLAGEAIAASPPGPVGRLVRWVRRKPTVAVGALTMLLALTLVGVVAYRFGRGDAAQVESADEVPAGALGPLAALLDKTAAGEVRGADQEEDVVVALSKTEGGVDPVPLLIERLGRVEATAWGAIEEVLAEGAKVTAQEESAGAASIEGVPGAVRAWRTLAPGASLDPVAQRLIRRAGERVERRQARAHHTQDLVPRMETIFAQRQEKALGHRIRMAELICRALGRLADPRAVETLGRYLRAEQDPMRAQAPALALCRTGGFQAFRYVVEARYRFGQGSPFARPILEAFGRFRDTLPPARTFDDMLVRGRGRLMTKEWAAAEKDGSSAIELAYQDPRGWVLRAEARFQLRNLRGARDDAKRAILLAPRHARAWLVRGAVAGQLKRFAQAEKHLSEAIEADPSNAEAWALRGETRALLGRLAAGTADAERAIKLRPSGIAGYRARAVVRFRRRDQKGSAADFKRALELEPDNIATHLYLARLKQNLRDSEGALTLANVAVDRARGRELGEAYAVRGAILSERGATVEAIRDLERATRLNSEDSEAWMYLGVAKARLQRTGEARSALDLSIKLFDQNPLAYANRAAVYKQSKDYARALKDAEKALKLDPSHVYALALRGELRSLSGRLEEGIADLEKVVKREPRTGHYWLWLGDARKKAGRRVQAKAAYQQAVTVEPGRADGWSRLIVILHHEDRAKGLEMADRAVQAVPHSPRVWRMRGTLRAKAKRFREAEADLTEALKRDPRDLEGWAARGAVRSILGKAKLAAEDLKRAVAPNPRSATLWLKRASTRAVLGDLRGSLSDYERIEPFCAPSELPTLWFNRGECRLGTGANIAGARADLLRYLKARPNGRHVAKARHYLALIQRRFQR